MAKKKTARLPRRQRSGRHVVVTAGPTREPIDPVRYISNRSTGAMGYALAESAMAAGHDVLLVLGPAEEQPPVDIDVVSVETTAEMLDAVLEYLPQVDAVICAAAVCDYRPAARSETKIKRGGMATLELVENPDIAAEVGQRRGDRPLVVFALESENGLENARGKLDRKNGTLCVLNSPEAIGAAAARFTLVFRDGRTEDLGEIDKRDLFERLGL